MNFEPLEQKFSVPEKGQHRGDWHIAVGRESIHELLRFLKNEEPYQFDLLIDLTAVDTPERTQRFEVVYQLYSLAKNHRLEVRVPLPAEDPVIDSVTNLWKSADWYEREVYDLFGIKFAGHPNLKRILLPETFEGHPLRKDYPMEKRQKIPVPMEKP